MSCINLMFSGVAFLLLMLDVCLTEFFSLSLSLSLLCPRARNMMSQGVNQPGNVAGMMWVLKEKLMPQKLIIIYILLAKIIVWQIKEIVIILILLLLILIAAGRTWCKQLKICSEIIPNYLQACSSKRLSLRLEEALNHSRGKGSKDPLIAALAIARAQNKTNNKI